MKTLKRRQSSGFVKYPKEFAKRTIDGTARFRTKCDMLVGPCACGGVHQEQDEWVNDLLAAHDATIETLTLAPDDSGIIAIPRYWLKPRQHTDCTVLHGQCACGKTHTVNERWASDLLCQHGAKVVGCPESDLPVTSPNCQEVTMPESVRLNPYYQAASRQHFANCAVPIRTRDLI